MAMQLRVDCFLRVLMVTWKISADGFGPFLPTAGGTGLVLHKWPYSVDENVVLPHCLNANRWKLHELPKSSEHQDHPYYTSIKTRYTLYRPPMTTYFHCIQTGGSWRLLSDLPGALFKRVEQLKHVSDGTSSFFNPLLITLRRITRDAVFVSQTTLLGPISQANW